VGLSSKPMKDLSAWNMTGCLDHDKNLYLWGSIFSLKESHCLQIDEPELMHEVKLSQVSIGHSMIAGVESSTKILQVIACNDNSLESTATFNQFQFKPLPEIRDKPIELFALGKSGFLVAIGQLEEAKSPGGHEVSFSVEETKVKEM
jgi:hypothetical protein